MSALYDSSWCITGPAFPPPADPAAGCPIDENAPGPRQPPDFKYTTQPSPPDSRNGSQTGHPT